MGDTTATPSAHLRLPDLDPEMFDRWLALFGATCRELFEPELANALRQRAMFFASSALCPLWRVKESGLVLYWVCVLNPFTSATELIRFALYARLDPVAACAVAFCTLLFMAVAVIGYDPGRGFMARRIAAD